VRIIIKIYLKKYNGGKNWIYLAQDRDQWWAFANTVMNLRFPRNVENLLNGRATVGGSSTVLLYGVRSYLMTIGSEVHPTSCSMGTGGSFTEDKVAGA
jgi:hypothetical protein